MEQGGKTALGWAARDATGVLSPYSFSTRVQGDDDVTIKVLYCGICHTDLHFIKNDWGTTMYPVVPGHEIVGVVAGVGSGVTKFKAGDTVGVGYYVDTCRSCEWCGAGHENYCAGLVPTSNGVDHRHGGAVTRGGFSDTVVVNEGYVVRVPDGLPLDRAAPLLCAGVTVTVVSSSPGKRQEALDRLGADEFLVSSDAEQMKAAASAMDGIIDTVSAWHPVAPLLQLLKPMGQLVVVGGPSKPLELPVVAIVPGGKGVNGSLVGSVADCQAMLDFAGKHGIGAEVEVVKMDYVNTALERLEKNDVRYRFVIDVAGSNDLGSAA
ncbi:hypothetical protein PR202_gb16160 [Eleusine coracana subsp. coracana]|uniref:Probable cinnamyl alcohol dehydrogenase n=1 Tax=Eleusine coracana subsp. coracana TaxID=191504 RepID=A0AAV5EXH6_ELECO|nr:hypothetical protein QOZ80_9BG0702140 [Eleusine coracana subsp. coracana]GJN28078.1 hypothetical protein PR202_gb16160 [Eleusine coracana subsp. coracana]